MTRRFLSPLVGAALGLLLVAFVGLPFTTYVLEPDASSMTISGTSTLHDWDCDVPQVQGRIQMDTSSASAAEDILPGITGTNVQIPVQDIECHKDRMNNNLRDALEANAYPTILFSLNEAAVAPLPDSSDAWFQVDANGELIIAGERRAVDVPTKAQRLGDGSIRFVGSTSFKMSEWGVEPPSVMLGTIKTGDEVTISFDVVAAPQDS